MLEAHLPPTRYANHGRRVVEGQRSIQAQLDTFLGWTAGDGGHRHFYIRQHRDWKGSAEIDGATPGQLAFYADLCGPTLARGHARSGDPEVIRAYAGRTDVLDRSITAFAEKYAAQNLEDFEGFTQRSRMAASRRTSEGRIRRAGQPLGPRRPRHTPSVRAMSAMWTERQSPSVPSSSPPALFALVIIPAYNEVESLPRVLAELTATLPDSTCSWSRMARPTTPGSPGSPASQWSCCRTTSVSAAHCARGSGMRSRTGTARPSSSTPTVSTTRHGAWDPCRRRRRRRPRDL